MAGGYRGSWEKNSHNSVAVVWLDAVVGEWLDWLKQRDLLDRTLIVFTADHGLMGKRTCNEHGSRVPLIFRGPPSLVRPGTRVNSLVALHDIAATLLHLGSRKSGPTNPAAAAIAGGDGVSLWPTLGGQPVRYSVVCEIGYDRAVVGVAYKLVLRDFDPDRPINTGVTAHR